MLRVKSTNMYNIKKHINMHITKSTTGVLLKKPKEKERICILLHTKINTYYTHIFLNLVAPW